MADTKDSSSFFRKVVKFVANPATDWAQLGAPAEEARESEYAKSELKAMIERKRRNDFVRKREFDMLRKVRREGLTSEQLATLGGSSRLDDSEVRQDNGARADGGVKAKIDEIEQQMVGDGLASPSMRRTPQFYDAPTQPAAMGYARTMPDDQGVRGNSKQASLRTSTPASARSSAPPVVPSNTATVVMGAGLSPLSPLELDAGSAGMGGQFAELSEVAHDPELDEA